MSLDSPSTNQRHLKSHQQSISKNALQQGSSEYTPAEQTPSDQRPLKESKQHAFFVTGTDTEVGKTFVSCALLAACHDAGLSTAAYKPVSAGCDVTQAGLRNEDALALQQASNTPLSYDEVNPIAFAEPIAPHLACEKLMTKGQGAPIELDTINEGYVALIEKKSDMLLVEGAGGWRLPLGQNSQGQEQFLSDFAISQKLPVILVVGMRLGCINHALLTAQSIEQDGLNVAGWVANMLEPEMPFLEENIHSLARLLNAPLIARVPRAESPIAVKARINLSLLGVKKPD
ncbi:dethiobiotin synthase [Paraglaciecola sp. T6c]|uniref:dethiobiotin synthase n=1 Tax=Pseudoalteromonas atlantica (strain T6c / ATCC BAA-1087) TaxID=3042615 RepID=UPI00005C759B|nr:dethiobiotin synthase [Paraglaciecola sp. T6c]ABG41070.1 dethiobiotin synthase [Paraglaciecola sp. T6c]